jgi:SAM-dependent methyltransferase
MTADSNANADQIAYWNATAGLTWAASQDLLDRQIDPLGRKAMAALAPQEGERILDVGCGCGQTSLELAELVGPGGEVLSVDISEPMLEVARARAEGLDQVSFLEADAQTHAFPDGAFDAVFSRFGVMFFADPVAAFANIAAALKPGGRLAFVCWRPLAENSWMSLPLIAALPHIPPPTPPDQNAPGPFAFANPDKVRAILAAAGFDEIALTPHNQAIGGNDLEATIGLSLRVGPLGAVVRENPHLKTPVIEALRAALTPHLTPQGVFLPSATWIVEARKA